VGRLGVAVGTDVGAEVGTGLGGTGTGVGADVVDGVGAGTGVGGTGAGVGADVVDGVGAGTGVGAGIGADVGVGVGEGEGVRGVLTNMASAAPAPYRPSYASFQQSERSPSFIPFDSQTAGQCESLSILPVIAHQRSAEPSSRNCNMGWCVVGLLFIMS